MQSEMYRTRKLMLLSSVRDCLPDMSYRQVAEIHKAVGFETGLIEVVNDDAYEKANQYKRRRNTIVYTTPHSRAETQHLK